jgi:hypothetical protein
MNQKNNSAHKHVSFDVAFSVAVIDCVTVLTIFFSTFFTISDTHLKGKNERQFQPTKPRRPSSSSKSERRTVFYLLDVEVSQCAAPNQHKLDVNLIVRAYFAGRTHQLRRRRRRTTVSTPVPDPAHLRVRLSRQAHAFFKTVKIDADRAVKRRRTIVQLDSDEKATNQ